MPRIIEMFLSKRKKDCKPNESMTAHILCGGLPVLLTFGGHCVEPWLAFISNLLQSIRLYVAFIATRDRFCFVNFLDCFLSVCCYKPCLFVYIYRLLLCQQHPFTGIQLVVFKVVCLILSKLFFILIVSFLCQSDLMNVIQDKTFFSSLLSRRFQYWVIAVLPPADWMCFFFQFFRC